MALDSTAMISIWTKHETANMLLPLIITTLLHFAKATPMITVYGDVFKDREFFTTTFPWIIDHIGGEIMMEFYMVGSGRYSIPQMCALKEMSKNAFLQAQYLKCEAEGNPSAYCLCETGIDPGQFKECVNQGGILASYAASRFMKLNIGTTPLIELGTHSTVFEVSATWYLKKICSLFTEPKPLGCVTAFECCRNASEPFVAKKAVAHFDKECKPCQSDYEYTTTISTTSDYYNYHSTDSDM